MYFRAQEYGLEAAFRSVHTRLRTHAESIAFFGGGEREGATIAGYFDRLLSHRRRVIDIRQDDSPCSTCLRQKVSCILTCPGLLPRSWPVLHAF